MAVAQGLAGEQKEDFIHFGIGGTKHGTTISKVNSKWHLKPIASTGLNLKWTHFKNLQGRVGYGKDNGLHSLLSV